MSTKLYISIVAGVSCLVVLVVALVAGLRQLAQTSPARPAGLSTQAVWRPTPTETVALFPHGDWVSCWNAGARDHCRLTDATGRSEFDGEFIPVPGGSAVPNARLKPIDSQTISPWMWSRHEGRFVPVIHLEDGTVLAPVASASDLRGYVERVLKFSPRLKPIPIYAQYYHPAGSK